MVWTNRPRLPASGWRRTAVINSIVVSFFALILISLMIWVYASSDSRIDTWIFYLGDCSQGSRINVVLHLIINLISTLIIASSNFFMQILNAPTRKEVDTAHQQRSWLEIGVPSMRNVLHVSRLKTLCWILFNLSSIPIHLVFNSAIFETDYQGGEWWHTIATESFLNDGNYSSIGVGLIPTGITTQGQIKEYNPYNFDGYSIVEDGLVSYGGWMSDQTSTNSWLEPAFNFTQWNTPGSLAQTTISATAKSSSSWANLTAQECRKQYQACQGRRQYRNLVMVLDSGDNASGWALEDLYNMSQVANTTIDGDFMNMSISTPNGLWWSGRCQTWALVGFELSPIAAISCPP